MFLGLGKEFGDSFAACLVAVIVCAGCGPREGQPPGAAVSGEVTRVSGKVTRAGEALGRGVVEFEPLGEDGGRPMAAAIRDGEFQLAADRDFPGGTYQVRIYSAVDEGDEASGLAPPAARVLNCSGR